MADTGTATGRIYDLARQFQSELRLSQAAATDQMLAAWSQAHRASRAGLQGVLDKIKAAQEAGQPISPAWLYQETRLRAVLETTQAEMDKYAAQAIQSTTDAQRAAQAASMRQSGELLKDAAPVLSGGFIQPNPDNLRHLAGFLSDGTPLASLLGGLGAETADQVRHALVTGTALGKGPVWMARRITEALDMPRHRAITIMRTESQRVYRAVAGETYQANADVLEGWVWTATLSSRTCGACLAMHGTIHALTETLDGHPRCRCAMVPRTKSWSDILGPEGDLIHDTRPYPGDGKAWLTSQPPSVQRGILGNAKWKAWRDGDITLDDVVARTHSPQWGTMRRERSLVEIRQGRNPNPPTRMVGQPLPTPAAPSSPEWVQWEKGRDLRVPTVTSGYDVARTDALIVRYGEKVPPLEKELATAKATLKAEQARLASYVPDAKERAKFARKDTGILRAKGRLRTAQDELDHAKAMLAEQAKARAAMRTADSLPEFSAGNPLKAYGDRLVVNDHSPVSRKHLADLEEIPLEFHKVIRDSMATTDTGGFYIGDLAMPDLDHLSHLKNETPRGWAPGDTWAKVPGAYSPRTRVCACGGGGKGHGSTSLALHEGGHALDHAFSNVGKADGTGWNWRASETASWRHAYDALEGSRNPYFSTGGNADGYLSETWAESFAAWVKVRHASDWDQQEAIRAALGMSPAHRHTTKAVVDYFRTIHARLKGE